MDIEKILKLIDAGFTKDEIMAFSNGSAPEAAPADPEPAPDPAPAPAPAPAAPAAPAQPDAAAAIGQKLDQVLDALKAAAIRESRQPPQETADDILAAVIRPPRKE